MAISFNNIRVGHQYKMINFGEEAEFEVLEIRNDGDFKVKDLHTLEQFLLKDLIKFGKGRDFNLYEL